VELQIFRGLDRVEQISPDDLPRLKRKPCPTAATNRDAIGKNNGGQCRRSPCFGRWTGTESGGSVRDINSLVAFNVAQRIGIWGYFDQHLETQVAVPDT